VSWRQLAIGIMMIKVSDRLTAPQPEPDITRVAHRPSVPHACDVGCSASWAVFPQMSRAALLDIRGVLGSARPGIRVTFGLPQLNLTYLR
jgi:hypothetical protein